MSSWFARSLANSLRLDDDDDGDIQNDIVTESPTTSPRNNDYQQQQDNNAIESEEENDETLQGRGVKEDLDEIKQTLTRQFWGMASFLAPPPSSTISQDEHEQQRQVDDDIISNQNSEMEQGVFRRDDPEPNSNTFGSDSEGEHEREFDIQCAVGITEEVLTFAMNIAMHPETWLDFPIDEEDDNDGNHSISLHLQIF